MAAHDPDAERKRRELLLALLLLLLADTAAQLTTLTAALVAAHPTNGTNGSSVLDVPEDAAGTFGDKMEALLLPAHAAAVHLGRTLAGVGHPMNADDTTFAEAEWERQAPFLRGFVEALAAGDLSPAQVAARAQLYGKALLGTANRAWTEALPDLTLIDWHLGGIETHHCEDCPTLAAQGPYTADTLPAVPGDGSTACENNCRCWLTTDSGMEGFRLPADAS